MGRKNGTRVEYASSRESRVASANASALAYRLVMSYPPSPAAHNSLHEVSVSLMDGRNTKGDAAQTRKKTTTCTAIRSLIVFFDRIRLGANTARAEVPAAISDDLHI